MSRYLFTFSGLELLAMQQKDRPDRCIFRIMWRENGRILAQITTGRTLTYTYKDGKRSTFPDVLPKTNAGMQKRLKTLARKQLENEPETAENAAILAALK